MEQNNDDELAIRALLKEWLDAIRAGDYQAATDLMTDDAVFLRAEAPPLDKAAFLAAAASKPYRSPLLEFIGKIRDLHVQSGVAYMWADVSTTTSSSAWAGPVKREGHSLAVFRKERGRWLLARSADTSVPM